MNLSHLKYVLEVEHTGSINKAAQNLYMGQPNLSKAIKDLENEIGITIFKRNAKGVEPTAKGYEFLHYAKNIVSQLDELEALYKPQEEKSCIFNISVPRVTYISDAFANFINDYKEYDSMKVRFCETNPLGVIRDVASGESDIGIIRYQNTSENYYMSLLKSDNLDFELLCEFKMLLLMSKDHPLAQYKDILYHDLVGYTEIVHGDYQIPSVAFSDMIKNNSMEQPHRRIYVYDRGSQYNLLNSVEGSYMWVSPVPKHILDKNGFILRECSQASKLNRDVIIYPKGQKLSSTAKVFLKIVKQAALIKREDKE